MVAWTSKPLPTFYSSVPIYRWCLKENCERPTLVREDWVGSTYGVPVVYLNLQNKSLTIRKSTSKWFKTTLKYWMMVERYPNLKKEVGGSIPSCEISSLLDKKPVRWSTASCALTLACRFTISKIKIKIYK